MKADLVCKGGGIKGIALVGAIEYLEECGYNWQRFAGTSAGAIVASLLAVGYNAKEIKEMLFEINYTSFSDKNLLHSIPVVGQIFSLLFNKGLYAGNTIEDFISEKLAIKGKTKFKDLYENGESKLKIIASDVTNKKLIILPDDLVNYGINPMEFEISKAVRMSISIPFYYNPVIIDKDFQKNFIVDGGLVSNFPIWIFDCNKIPRWPTFGLNLTEAQNTSKKLKHTNFLSYILDVAETSLSNNDIEHLQDKDTVRIIDIPTYDVNIVDFNLTASEKIKLYDSGYNSAKSFIKTWDFNDYILRYRLK